MPFQETSQGYIYEKEIEIRFYDCDLSRRARISTLMRYLSDIAVVDYAQRGYDYQWLMDRNMIFLLSRMSIRVEEMPGADETLILKTWEHEVKGALFFRNFQFCRPDGSHLVGASTAWLLVDPNTRKILRPSVFSQQMQCCPDRDPQCAPAEKVKIPVPLSPAGSRRIVYSDLDANGHLNNANYGNIAMDVLPEEWQRRRVTDFLINFNHEARQGDLLELETGFQKNECFVEAALGDQNCFTCRITFAE